MYRIYLDTQPRKYLTKDSTYSSMEVDALLFSKKPERLYTVGGLEEIPEEVHIVQTHNTTFRFYDIEQAKEYIRELEFIGIVCCLLE
jgi:hypothetical protein